MRVITIDCHEIGNEADFWKACLWATQPDGTACFGSSLDAFRDALRGGPGWPGECALKFTDLASVERLRDGAFLRELRRIARESEQVQIEST